MKECTSTENKGITLEQKKILIPEIELDPPSEIPDLVY